MMYPFYILQYRLYQIGLLTLVCAMAGLSGCTRYSCPGTGILYDDSSQCEESCRPPPTYSFPIFKRESPGQSAKVHLFVDGNGRGTVTEAGDLSCSVTKCGKINGKISCKAEFACTKDFKAGTVVILEAVANEGSSFYGWGGDEDCKDGVVTVTDTDIYCIAAFNIAEATKCSEI